MPKYEYRPRPSKDSRVDCIRAGWRTTEDLLPADNSSIASDVFSMQVGRLRERLTQGQLDGTWFSAFSRPIFDIDKTQNGEVLFLTATVGANTILHFADVTIE